MPCIVLLSPLFIQEIGFLSGVDYVQFHSFFSKGVFSSDMLCNSIVTFHRLSL